MELRNRTVVRVVLAASITAGLAAILLNWGSLTAPLSEADAPGAVERIFGVPPVIGAVRIGTVMIMSYLAGSVGGLAIEGRLLVRAGPGGAEAEPAGALAGLGLSNLELKEALLELRESIEEVWEFIDHSQHDVDE